VAALLAAQSVEQLSYLLQVGCRDALLRCASLLLVGSRCVIVWFISNQVMAASILWHKKIEEELQPAASGMVIHVFTIRTRLDLMIDVSNDDESCHGVVWCGVAWRGMSHNARRSLRTRCIT
jgi:hypothetical protein